MSYVLSSVRDEKEDLVIAKKMLAKRFNPELIKEITGLSDQDLLSLEN